MTINWQLLMPELIIVCTFLLVLVFDLFESIQKSVLALLTIAGSAIALYVSIDMLRAGTVGTGHGSGRGQMGRTHVPEKTSGLEDREA